MPSYITVNGLQLWVTDTKSGAKGAVLLLHGWPDESQIWAPQIAALSAAGYRVIAPDLPGLGSSPGPQELAQYNLASSVASAMFALLDALSVDRVSLVGHDLGATLAWEMAVLHPERVTRMVALSTGWPGTFFTADPMAQRSASWFIPFVLLPGSDASWTGQANDFTLLLDFLQLNSTQEQAVSYVIRLAQGPFLMTACNLIRANFSVDQFGSTATQLPANPLNMPVLGVHADGDAYCLEAQMIASQLAVANGCWQYEKLFGVGHWMMRDEPDTVNKLLLKFLASKQQPVDHTA